MKRYFQFSSFWSHLQCLKEAYYLHLAPKIYSLQGQNKDSVPQEEKALLN